MMQIKNNDTTTKLGREAETQAADYLKKQGLRIVMQNFRVRGGEIDLICRDDHLLIFVEVRLRRNLNFASAAESITSSKRRRILLAAEHYRQKHRFDACRFDCVLMDGKTIEWVKNAFSADD